MPGVTFRETKLVVLDDGVSPMKGAKPASVDISAEFLPLSEVDTDNPEVLFNDAAAVDQNILAESKNRTVADEAGPASTAVDSDRSKGFFWDDPVPDSPKLKTARPASPGHSNVATGAVGVSHVALGAVGVYNLSVVGLKPLSSGKDPLQGKNLLAEVTVIGGKGEQVHKTKPRRKGEEMKYPEVFQVRNAESRESR